MANGLKKARKEYDNLVLRVGEKQDALKPIEARLIVLPGDLVDAQDAQTRGQLIAERAHLVEQQDILKLELEELTRRRDLALLTAYEVEATLAVDEWQKAHDKNRAAIKSVEDADRELRWYMNHTDRQHTPEFDETVKNLKVKVATLKAEQEILAKADRDLGNVAKQARQELAEVKQELGIPA